MIHLLLRGHLPSREELASLKAEIRNNQMITKNTTRLLEDLASHQIPPIDALRLAIGRLIVEDPAWDKNDKVSLLHHSTKLVAQAPTIVATYFRLLEDLPAVRPKDSGDFVSNLAYMLSGESSEPAVVEGLTTYLVTVAENSLNASTFTARIIASTGGDLSSAMVGAIGALKGPLHGGAPLFTLQQIQEILRSGVELGQYVREKVTQKELMMGFGHRIFKTTDPRAPLLLEAARRVVARQKQNSTTKLFYERAVELEHVIVRTLREVRPDLPLHTNIEFGTAVLLHVLGFREDLFPALFAVGRLPGWCAHVMEQKRTNRLFTPDAIYVGPQYRPFIHISKRSEEGE